MFGKYAKHSDFQVWESQNFTQLRVECWMEHRDFSTFRVALFSASLDCHEDKASKYHLHLNLL